MQILDNNQFFFVAFAHFLAVVSPGPDFILINRQSFLYGRNSAVTTIGDFFWNLIHVCILCFWFFNYNCISSESIRFIKFNFCSFYLIYLGYYSLFHLLQLNPKRVIIFQIIILKIF